MSTARATRLPHRCQSDPDRCTARSENSRGGILVRKRRESDAVGPFRRAACTRLQRASCTASRCLLCTNRSSSSPSHINLVSQGIHRTEAPASVKDTYLPGGRPYRQLVMYVCTYIQPLVRTLHPMHTWRIVRGPRMAVAYLARRPDCAADTNGCDTYKNQYTSRARRVIGGQPTARLAAQLGFSTRLAQGESGSGRRRKKQYPGKR